MTYKYRCEFYDNEFDKECWNFALFLLNLYGKIKKILTANFKIFSKLEYMINFVKFC